MCVWTKTACKRAKNEILWFELFNRAKKEKIWIYLQQHKIIILCWYVMETSLFYYAFKLFKLSPYKKPFWWWELTHLNNNCLSNFNKCKRKIKWIILINKSNQTQNWSFFLRWHIHTAGSSSSGRGKRTNERHRLARENE